MIKVTGRAYLIVDVNVSLDMTEDEFESLSEKKQDELLESAIDWHEACRDATVDSFEVDDWIEIDKTEEAS